MNTNTQENIMLIAHKVTTNTDYLGNRMYMTTPWVMSERKMHDFLDGTISLHQEILRFIYLRTGNRCNKSRKDWRQEQSCVCI